MRPKFSSVHPSTIVPPYHTVISSYRRITNRPTDRPTQLVPLVATFKYTQGLGFSGPSSFIQCTHTSRMYVILLDGYISLQIILHISRLFCMYGDVWYTIYKYTIQNEIYDFIFLPFRISREHFAPPIVTSLPHVSMDFEYMYVHGVFHRVFSLTVLVLFDQTCTSFLGKCQMVEAIAADADVVH